MAVRNPANRTYWRMVAGLPLSLALAGCPATPGASSQFGTERVSRGDLTQRVTASGSLGAVVSVDVGSQVSGKIAAVYVDFNSRVTRGQLVAVIDPSIYQAALRQAQGELAAALADATYKRQDRQRKQKLAALNAVSDLDLQQAVAAADQADASVQIKRAALQRAQLDLGYCRITAPVDGLVIARKVDQGQTVAANFNTPILFTIAQDIRQMNISAAVSEADIGQVRDGQAVEFSVEAYPDEVFHGLVKQVRRAPTTSSNVVTYETLIGVSNPQEKLFPGMTADVSIVVAQRLGVLKLPNTALRYSPPDGTLVKSSVAARLQPGQRLVYLPAEAGEGLRIRAVRVGITDGLESEVLEGLTEGNPVVSFTVTPAQRRSSLVPSPPPNG